MGAYMGQQIILYKQIGNELMAGGLQINHHHGKSLEAMVLGSEAPSHHLNPKALDPKP